VVVRGVTQVFDDLGSGTSEDAEWLALRTALRIAQASGESDFDLLGDSAHVIAQANGTAKGRGQAALDHRAAFGDAAASAPPRRIRWIQRNQNLAGIALARRRALP
jgi:ribonuclease HI